MIITWGYKMPLKVYNSSTEVVVAIKYFIDTAKAGSLRICLQDALASGFNLNALENRPFSTELPDKKDTWLLYALNNGSNITCIQQLITCGNLSMAAEGPNGKTFLNQYLSCPLIFRLLKHLLQE